MKKVDTTNIKEAGEFSRPAAGAYNAIILKVEDVSDKEYLKITYDIAEGEYRGYYSDLRKRFPDSPWIGAYVKSYKAKALPMFKRFCSAVSKSNGNYIFDGGSINADERTLVKKRIGIVLQEEEYYSNSGDLRTRLIVNRECPVSEIGSQKIPQVKKLKEEPPKPKADDYDPFLNIMGDVEEEAPWS